MDERITDTFLENNLFEKDKIGCGYFPWRYHGKDYDVVIVPWTDGGSYYIYVSNNKNHTDIQFSRRKTCGNFLTKEDLHNCIKFMGVPDEFDYNI